MIGRPRPLQLIKDVSWIPPNGDVVKINTDGCSLGNPGYDGAGIVSRNSNLEVPGVIAKGVGIVTSYEGECQALVSAAELAAEKEWREMWFEADSMTLVCAFSKGRVPWHLLTRWRKATEQLISWKISHTCREVNFAANAAAKHGAQMDMGSVLWSAQCPTFVTALECPGRIYYRFA